MLADGTFDDAEPDPSRTSATDNGLTDARIGARIGSRRRVFVTRARRVRRAPNGLDIGEPGVPRVVLGLLLLTIFVTLVEFSTYGSTPDGEQLDRINGMSSFALARGDWQAVVLGNLLHLGFQHIFFNCFTIYLVGRWVEHVLGRAATLAVIGWSALGCSVGALLLAPQTVSVGASGVAFGLLGAAVVADPRARTEVGQIAWVLTVVNLFSTFLIPGISVGGHLGGLVAGVVVGAVVFSRRATEDHPLGRPRRVPAAVLAGIAVVTLAWLACWGTVAPDSARARGEEVVAWVGG